MIIITKTMKIILIFIYNFIFKIYNKITFKDNSAHAAFSLTIGFIYMVILIALNKLVIYFWNINIIKEINGWLNLLFLFTFYFIVSYFLKKILKNDKRAKCSDLL